MNVVFLKWLKLAKFGMTCFYKGMSSTEDLSTGLASVAATRLVEPGSDPLRKPE